MEFAQHTHVYMAGSIALAVLENLVHMSREDFPSGYVHVTPGLPDDVAVLSEADLRTDQALRQLPAGALGDPWLSIRLRHRRSRKNARQRDRKQSASVRRRGSDKNPAYH